MFAIERPATLANGDAGKRVSRDQFAAQATGAADDAEERHADDIAALVVECRAMDPGRHCRRSTSPALQRGGRTPPPRRRPRLKASHARTGARSRAGARPATATDAWATSVRRLSPTDRLTS